MSRVEDRMKRETALGFTINYQRVFSSVTKRLRFFLLARLEKISPLLASRRTAVFIQFRSGCGRRDTMWSPRCMGVKHNGIRPPVAGDGRRCLVCLLSSTLPRRRCLECAYIKMETCTIHPVQQQPRRRNRERTRTDADATAWDQFLSYACTRSRLQSGPC